LLTFGDALAQLQGAEAGGFSFSATQAASLLNEGVKRFAARSEWIKAEVDLGPTVANQEAYALPANCVKLKGLEVGSVVYIAVDLLSLWQYKQQGLPGNINGVYAERFSEDGKIKSFSVYPVPDVAGEPISGLAVITPEDLEAADNLPFPAEYNRGPVDYAKGIAYEDVDENPDSGTYFIKRADERADELRLEAQSRTGSGPYKIPVATARLR